MNQTIGPSSYCTHMSHSRPATPEEYRDDYGKREAAIARATAEGTHSANQIAEAQETLKSFTGYRRCTA